jgi:bacterioferritin-associated ferredoxin
MQNADDAYRIGTFNVLIDHNVRKHQANSNMLSQFWACGTNCGMIGKAAVKALKSIVEFLGGGCTGFFKKL